MGNFIHADFNRFILIRCTYGFVSSFNQKERLYKMSHPDWPNNKLFHRKGLIGQGKAAMDKDQLQYLEN